MDTNARPIQARVAKPAALVAETSPTNSSAFVHSTMLQYVGETEEPTRIVAMHSAQMYKLLVKDYAGSNLYSK